MKSRAILLLLGLMISSSFVFGQIPIDALQKDSVLSQLKNYFSTEQSWQISKEAYKKQLEAKGLSENEIKQKILEFEKQKPALIERIKKQLKTVEKQMELSGVQRKMAEEELQKFEKQWNSGEFQRQIAEAERQAADAQRKFAEEFSTNTKILLNKNITLSDNDSKTKYVRVKVTKSNTMFINVSGYISSGRVLLEISNPKGQNRGYITLAHRNGSYTPKTWLVFSDNTSGSVNNIINAPKTGVWLVKISPKKSKGHIHISFAQYTKPTN